MHIGDASFIGLKCDTGNVDDCNDLPDERVVDDCKGVLILSEKSSKCGSKCELSMERQVRTNQFKFVLVFANLSKFA